MDNDMIPPAIECATSSRVLRIRAALGAQSPRERAKEKLGAALRWLFCWHKTTPGLLRRVVQVQADGYASQLERCGKAQIYRTTKVRGGRVVMLSDEGLALAEGMFPRHIGTYDTRWASVRQQLLVHDLAVQVAVLSVMDKRPVYRYLPEHLAGHKDTAGDKRPDCRLWFDQGQIRPYGMEVERTSKKPGQELDNTLIAAARAVENDLVAGQIFLFMNQPVLDLYKNTLARPLRLWERDKRAGRWIATGGHWPVAAEIQQRFQWLHRPKLIDGLLP